MKFQLSRLFGARERFRQILSPRVPKAARIYAIGDIHGRADLLADMHGKIARDAARHRAGRKLIVYLGDYIDRGLESRQVIEILLNQPVPGFEAVYLKGNHEDFMLRFLDDRSVGASWLMNGGNATLYSYGVGIVDDADADVRLRQLQADLLSALPAAHLAFLRELALYHIEGDYLFVHAGLRPGVPLDAQRPEDLMWIREEFLSATAPHEKVVVHGHSISWDPDVHSNRICIDTGAYASGNLTSLVLEGGTRNFLHTA